MVNDFDSHLHDLAESIEHRDINVFNEILALDWPASDLNEPAGESKKLPLTLAMLAGRPDMMRALIAKGAQVDGPTRLCPGFVDRPLHSLKSSLSCDEQEVRSVLSVLHEHGVNFQAADRFGNTPLFVCSKHQDEMETRLLIEFGARLAPGEQDVLIDLYGVDHEFIDWMDSLVSEHSLLTSEVAPKINPGRSSSGSMLL